MFSVKCSSANTEFPADEFDGKISDLSLHVLLGHLKEFFGKQDPVNVKTWITYI